MGPLSPFSSVMGWLGRRNGHSSTELVAGLEGKLGTLAHPSVPCTPSLILLEVACGVAAGQTGGCMGSYPLRLHSGYHSEAS